MNKVKRFKPVRIDAVSFAKRFIGREVKILKGHNDNGSRIIGYGTIVGSFNYEGQAHCTVTNEGATYYCSPEWLIHSGNDFSR